MASIKTVLRELSVPYGIHKNINNDTQDPTEAEFLNLMKSLLEGDQFECIASLHWDFSNSDQRSILNNGFVLANKIFEHFSISTIDNFRWYGDFERIETPIDIEINSTSFSLKEESYILENMGLYKLIGLLTGMDTTRGGNHIFKDFAKPEYEDWFNFSWNYLLDTARKNKDTKEVFWEYKSKNYSSAISIMDDSIYLMHINDDDEYAAEFPAANPISIYEYEEKTSPLIREKVFSKWLSKELSRNENYISIKKKCAVTAGNNLASFIEDNLNMEGLARFLQIYKDPYFYAKVVNATPEIYKVPSLDDFINCYKVSSVECNVPVSQVNILTTISDDQDQPVLTLRNEVRFSHGQFNGTPEAKLYYERGSNLENIYQRVC